MLMNTEQERKYYVDYRESGGVVHSEPTRMLPELVFTGRTKNQMEIELEQHAKMVQETLGEAANKGRRLERITSFVRRDFLDMSLPSPGIIELKDNFYTGWFYTTESGQMYIAYRGAKDNVPLSKHPIKSRREPYFLLDEKEAEYWSDKVKQNLLTVAEMDQLFLSPGIESHPTYEDLTKLNLKELTNKVGSIADNFWNNLQTFDRNDRGSKKREFFRDNLLELEIHEAVSYYVFITARKEIGESMVKNEITVFPLGQEGCVVRYGTNPENNIQTRTRTLPLPHNLMRHFQRYGRLGEQPMTKREFETLYRRLVDPNTQLHF